MRANELFKCLFILALDHAKHLLNRIGPYNISFLNKLSKGSYISRIYNPNKKSILQENLWS